MTVQAPAENSIEAWEAYSAWFAKRCKERRPLWNARIAKEMANTKRRGGKARSYDEIAKVIADNSATDLQRLESELNSLLMRTSIVVAAATLMFAAFLLKGTSKTGTTVAVGTTLLVVALLTTATSFILAVKALTPPIKRALTEPYTRREYWSLLVVDDFTRWVLNCWLANRRTDVITKYKKAHAFAVPLLVTAAVLTLPGLALVAIG